MLIGGLFNNIPQDVWIQTQVRDCISPRMRPRYIYDAETFLRQCLV